MYENEPLDKKRMFTSILFDLGWISLFIGIVMYMLSGADGLGEAVVSVMFILTMAAALVVIAGIIVLMSQRSKKYNITLSKSRMIIGLGLMMLGGLAAGAFALVSVIADTREHYETGIFFVSQCVMCAGGFVCFLFGLPMLKSYISRADGEDGDE